MIPAPVSEDGDITISFAGEKHPLPFQRIDDNSIAVRISGATRTSEHQAAHRAPRSGRVTDEDLRAVADVYLAATARGEPPVLAVEKEIGKSRPTAGRWVMMARERGFLPPARAKEGVEA